MKSTKKDFAKFLVFLKDRENKETLDVLFAEIASLIDAFMRKHDIV